MRATAQDPDTAGLMGVDVNRTIAITFLIGGALAGAAGVVQILYNNYTVYTLGFRFGLNSFTAAVLGGIGNLQGAVLGALILGEVNAFSDRYLSANWTQAIVFGVLIAILVFKPTGPPRPAAGGPGMSAATDAPIGTGVGRLAGLRRRPRSRSWPGQYRAALRRKRRRTIGLTLLIARGPHLPGHQPRGPGRLQPATSSRCRCPDDTVVDVHDDLRDHGHRPEHRRRLRRPARPRLRGVLRDRRLLRGVPRLAALRRARHQPDLPRPRRAGCRRDPPAVLDHRHRRGHRRRDLRRAARRTDPPAARRLPGDRDPRLRRDRAARSSRTSRA